MSLSTKVKGDGCQLLYSSMSLLLEQSQRPANVQHATTD
jgi:hypothetical protein